MHGSQGDRPFNDTLSNADDLKEHAITPAEKGGKYSKSMHNCVAVWCDCCSCEAEPYWAAVSDKIGTGIISDHKDSGMKE